MFNYKPLVLVVMDGWGIAPASEGNAITRANLPNYKNFIKNYPCLIISDFRMPKMDGVEVLRELSKKAKGKAEKVILLTDLAHDPVMKEALDLGAKAYLIKADMTPDQLVEKIKGYLK
jgi:DNA-binding NarL/FixJ family response regulator